MTGGEFPGPTEVRAAELAAVLTAESDVLDRRKVALQAAEVAGAEQVSGPGDPPTPQEYRQWALQLAAQQGHMVFGPSADDSPRQEYVIVTSNGPKVYQAVAPPAATVFGPLEAAAHDAAWQRRVRADEDKLLRAVYHEDELRKMGIL
jgi:hypothetical protein